MTGAIRLLALAAVALGPAGENRLPRKGSAAVAPRRQDPPQAAAHGPDVARPMAPPPGAPRAQEVRPAPSRVIAPRYASALFAQRSWYVAPPPAKPAPPPPPPAPAAPPFPYTFVGSYAPEGDRPVFFLARGDRVVDAHVGDQLDGVYRFESAAGGQLVFVYLPLDVRQSLAAGASR